MKDPFADSVITLQVQGQQISARAGQTVAAAMLAAGRLSWRTTARGRRPRGVFCGIGVCFDCLVTVNGIRDIRACQRRATDGDVIEFQDEALPKIPGGE
ncbi:(2Fe-2S)-binding protein [Microlunatus elymi]|uniref:(2Fe-2S)-binding protein n=1 Tax=Microlunatus elymi TaxID=2596828 RepID=A0A516PVR0_9ACTN|nr:(2Fe-2S)-binding protein [Microlunatus elymi]QDP95212.1 (2Fe-2S)-binding protein [Microlunatus elymi]